MDSKLTNKFLLSSDMIGIDESINSSFANLVTIFETNDFDSVIALADTNAEKSLYHSALKAQMSMMKAAFTMETVCIAIL